MLKCPVALAFLIVVGCGSSTPDTSAGGAPNTGGKPQSSGGSPGFGGSLGSSGSLGSGGSGAGASGGTPSQGGAGASGSSSLAGAASGGAASAGAASAGAASGGAASGGSTSGGAASGGSASGGASGGGGAGVMKSAGCDKARTLMDGNLTMTSGGQSRQWHVKTPQGYDQTHAYRVIFMYHWYYGSINAIVNPPDADKNTDRPYYGIADLSGDSTIFVVPAGLENGWANTGGRDSTFTDDMLKAVKSGLCVDTSRVFTTGFSYGGAISLKLACTRPEEFRAAVVYDTGTTLAGFNQSECKTPIALFESHGLDDQTFKYDPEGLKVLGIFSKLNGCTSQTPPMAADNAHTCVSFAGCSAGHPVRFCNFGKGQNNPKAGGPGGHYPSPKDPGQTTSWVPAEAWKFIEQF